MSRSVGAGSPVYFACSRCRSTLVGRMDARYELTGRKRPYRSSTHSSLGERSTLTRREYRCECGHVGWSNHVDLLAAELGRHPTWQERMVREAAP